MPNAEENNKNINGNQPNNEMIVTPWEVKGKVDYEKLIKDFGTQPLTDELLQKISKHTNGLHLQIQRHIFFSHRDLDSVLNLYEQGKKFVLYTGRGPSGPVHIGHLIPWILLYIYSKNLVFDYTSK